jgi:hypothetical protein
MIRPLRRHHRWIIPGLLFLLVIAAVLTLAHPAPSARLDVLPQEIVKTNHRGHRDHREKFYSFVSVHSVCSMVNVKLVRDVRTR